MQQQEVEFSIPEPAIPNLAEKLTQCSSKGKKCNSFALLNHRARKTRLNWLFHFDHENLGRLKKHYIYF